MFNCTARAALASAVLLASIAPAGAIVDPHDSADVWIDACLPELTGHGTAKTCDVDFVVSVQNNKPNALLMAMRALVWRGRVQAITAVPSYTINKYIYPYGQVTLACRTAPGHSCFTGIMTVQLSGTPAAAMPSSIEGVTVNGE